MKKKIIAVLLGDPSGVGPELVVRLLSENITNEANIVSHRRKKILEDGEKVSGKKIDLKFVENLKILYLMIALNFFLIFPKVQIVFTNAAKYQPSQARAF